jgi:ribonucleoside-diphosphate reductase alpha chain
MTAVKLQQTLDSSAISEIPMQAPSLDIWDKKYRLKTKSNEIVDVDIGGTYARVARA